MNKLEKKLKNTKIICVFKEYDKEFIEIKDCLSFCKEEIKECIKDIKLKLPEAMSPGDNMDLDFEYFRNDIEKQKQQKLKELDDE